MCYRILRNGFSFKHILYGTKTNRFLVDKRNLYTNTDTIYALSTSPAKSAIAVIRVSGTQSINILNKITKSTTKKGGGGDFVSLEPRKAYKKAILNSRDEKEVIDIGLVIHFQKPNSYTGEDMVEIHTHGGTAVTKAVLESISTAASGVRTAEPGEFTLRAFYNNKMDLTEVEGVLDLINAETKTQRQLALHQAEGKVRKLYGDWRERIIKVMAQIEAIIEFGDDEDIESEWEIFQDGKVEIAGLIESIEEHIKTADYERIVREGVKVAILGPPNVGKSSILNKLANEDVAIVSKIAGTTRDILEISLEIDGHLVRFYDTAGIHELQTQKPPKPDCKQSQPKLEDESSMLYFSQDTIELEGMKRAMDLSARADINLVVFEAGQESYDEKLNKVLKMDNSYILYNKADKVNADVRDSRWVISCLNGYNWNEWTSDLKRVIKERIEKSDSGSRIVANIRHREILREGIAHLKKFNESDSSQLIESAEELRMAANSISKITGLINTQQVLDSLFSQFCIGK